MNESSIDEFLNKRPIEEFPDYKTLTFGDLLDILKGMSFERLNDTATVYVTGVEEYYPVLKIDEAKETDVLDKGHCFIVV